MKKPYPFFGALLISIVILALVRLFLPPSKTPQPARPPLEVPPAPTIGIPQPISVVFSYSKEPSLPTELPVYAYTDFTREELESAVASVLSDFAIPASSTSLLRSGVFRRTWSRDGATVTLQDENGQATITFRQSVALQKPAATQSHSEIARSFIAKLAPPSPPLSLSPAGVSDDVAEGILITDNLGVQFVEGFLYSYTINALPVVPYPYTSQTSFAAVDNLGIVRAATVHPGPKTVLLSGRAPILSPQDIVANLTAGRGSLVSIAAQEDPKTVGAITFRAFSIDAVSLVYARHQGVLAPGFLIHGKGTAPGAADQEATFFLWASPATQQEPAR